MGLLGIGPTGSSQERPGGEGCEEVSRGVEVGVALGREAEVHGGDGAPAHSVGCPSPERRRGELRGGKRRGQAPPP